MICGIITILLLSQTSFSELQEVVVPGSTENPSQGTASYPEVKMSSQQGALAIIRRTDFYFLFGTTISPRTSYEYKFGNLDFSTKDKDRSGFALGFDGILRFTPNLGMSIVSDVVQYKYESGPPSDSLLHIGIGPRLAKIIGSLELWINLIGGYSINRFGETIEVSGDHISFLPEDRVGAFQISSRLGVDYEVLKLVKFRLQASYSTAEYDFEVNMKTYPGLTNIGKVSGSFVRSYISGQAGVAFLF